MIETRAGDLVEAGNRRLRRFLRRGAVQAATGLSCSTIYARIEQGTFPRPVPLGGRGGPVGWLEDEIAAWQEAQIAARDAQIGGGDAAS